MTYSQVAASQKRAWGTSAALTARCLDDLAGGDRSRSPEHDFKRVWTRWGDTVHTDGRGTARETVTCVFFSRSCFEGDFMCVCVCVECFLKGGCVPQSAAHHGDPRRSSLTLSLRDKRCPSSEWKPTSCIVLFSLWTGTGKMLFFLCLLHRFKLESLQATATR